MARKKNRGANNLENKFDAQGHSLADHQRVQEQQELDKKMMLEKIKQIIREARVNNRLTDQSFFLVHFNILARTLKEKDDYPKYLPCEYAVIEFSLKDGVKKELYGFIYPTKVPCEYTNDIRERADKTHKLDPISEPLASLARKDRSGEYSFILSKIKNMINPEGNSEYPPLFSLDDEVDCVRSIMDDLFQQSGQKEGRGKIQIFVLHELFFRLQSSKNPEYDDPILLKEKVEAEIYNYTADMACEFHEDEVDEPKYCSLMGVKRWAYIICDYLCQIYEVELVEGKHIPVDLDIRGNAYGRASHMKPRKKRYDANDPLNEFGVNKSRAMAAGVVLAPKEWTVVQGQSQHGLSMDRKQLEQQQYCATPPAPYYTQQEEYQDGSDRRGSKDNSQPNRECRPGSSSWSSNEWRPSPPTNDGWRPSPPAKDGWRPLPPVNEPNEGRPNGGGNRGNNTLASPAGSWVPTDASGSQSKETTPNLENSSEFLSLGGFPALGTPRGRGRGRGSQAERKRARGRGVGGISKQMNNFNI